MPSIKKAVPEQVSAIDVDDDQLICELSEPPLSSIIPDTKRTDYEAAASLDRMMSGETVNTDQPLITQPLGVSVRASTDTLALDDHRIAKALKFIRRHSTTNIRVADVFKQVGLSRRSLEHRFKKLIGHTPVEEIQRASINRIKELLEHTELPIGEITARTGFEYSEYMVATLKREVGCTPSEYRLVRRKT